jgi:hypothetical protein
MDHVQLPFKQNIYEGGYTDLKVIIIWNPRFIWRACEIVDWWWTSLTSHVARHCTEMQVIATTMVDCVFPNNQKHFINLTYRTVNAPTDAVQ